MLRLIVINIVVASLLLSGCQFLPVSNQSSSYLPLLEPDSLGLSAAVLQRVSGERDGHHYELLVQLEFDKKQLAMVASTTGGTTLFSLLQQGNEVTTTVSPLLPVVIKPQFVLADMQIMFWPLTVIEQALVNSRYQVLAVKGGRELLKEGNLVAKVIYSHENPWQGSVVFQHLDWQYQYQIDTLSFEPNE